MYRLTDKPIDLNELVTYVGDPGAGAVSTFIGTTRDNNEGRSILSLDYEAYPGMAEQEMARLGEEAAEKWRSPAWPWSTASAPCPSARPA